MKTSHVLPLLLAVLVSSFAQAAAATAAKPNIVLLFIDDMGYGDIGPFGSTKNRTPNLDRMAREAHYYYRGYKLEAVRVGPWKLALGRQNEGIGTTERKNSDAAKPGLRLYNLDDEIGEQTNVAAQHADVVQRLQALGGKMAADIGDGQPGPGVRPAGFVENPHFLFPSEAKPKKAKKK